MGNLRLIFLVRHDAVFDNEDVANASRNALWTMEGCTRCAKLVKWKVIAFGDSACGDDISYDHGGQRKKG